MNVQYISKSKLSWPDLWDHLGMTKDSGGRWYPGDDTPESVIEYLREYRSPSRSWPNSYATAMLTAKFAKWLAENEQLIAIDCGVAKEIEISN